MKISKVLLALGVLSSFALAEGAFMGIEGGYNLKTKVDDVKGEAPTFGLKAGYDFDNARFYGSYNYYAQFKDTFKVEDEDFDATFKFKAHKFLLNADFTPEITMDLKLILGVYAGISSGTINFDSPVLKINSTCRDFVAGARLGAEYSFDSNNAVEFGLKYDYTKYDLKIQAANVTIDDNIKEKNTGLYLGYNYKF